MKKILLVCTGNICRSPLAAALIDRALHGRGAPGIDLASAGTGAWDGAPVSEGAYLVGLERGLDLSGARLDGASLHGAKVGGVFFPHALPAPEILLSLEHGTRLRSDRP